MISRNWPKKSAAKWNSRPPWSGKKIPRWTRAVPPTAEILGFVFASLGKDDTERFVLHDFGYALGRWIYTTDAADDLEEDLKAGAFKPV